MAITQCVTQRDDDAPPANPLARLGRYRYGRLAGVSDDGYHSIEDETATGSGRTPAPVFFVGRVNARDRI
jgi:hypothetical protein